MSAFGLAGNLGIERAAAASYMDKYFSRYPGVAAYMERTRGEAKERGFVETVFGRRLWLPDIASANQARRQGAERQAINAPMQGTAADLIKLAMIAVQGWIESSGSRRAHHAGARRVVLEVPEGELERVKPQVEKLMTGVAELDVPLVVERAWGRTGRKRIERGRAGGAPARGGRARALPTETVYGLGADATNRAPSRRSSR